MHISTQTRFPRYRSGGFHQFHRDWVIVRCFRTEKSGNFLSENYFSKIFLPSRPCRRLGFAENSCLSIFVSMRYFLRFFSFSFVNNQYHAKSFSAAAARTAGTLTTAVVTRHDYRIDTRTRQRWLYITISMYTHTYVCINVYCHLETDETRRP